MNIFNFRFIIAIEYFAYYSVSPSIVLLALDQEKGLLGPEVSYSYRMFIYALFVGLYPFIQIFVAPIVGSKSDKTSRKTILQQILVCNVLGYLLFTLAILFQNAWFAVLGFLLPALKGSLVPVVKSGIAEAVNREERTREFSKLLVIRSSMTLLGPLMGLAFVQLNPTQPYLLPFYFSAALSLVALLSTAGFKLKSSHPEEPVFYEPQVFKKYPVFLATFLLIFLSYCLFIKFVPIVLVKRFDSTTWVNYFFIISGFMGIVNQTIYLRLLKMTHRAIPFLLFFMFISISLFCYDTTPLSLCWLAMALFCLSTVTVQIEGFLSQLAPQNSLGKMQGLLFGVENISYLSAPLLGAYLATFNPEYSITSAALAAFLALCFYLVADLMQKRKIFTTSTSLE